MAKPVKIILIVAGTILGFLILAGIGLIWLSSREYKPADRESVTTDVPAIAPVVVAPSLSLKPARFQPIELYIWNIGYASLGAKEDFFMDGGKGVRPVEAGIVEENIRAIQAFFASVTPDIVFLQEIDVYSKQTRDLDFKNSDHNPVIIGI